PSSYSGPTSVSGGSLVLDYSILGASANILPGTTDLTLGGGRVVMAVGPVQAVSQSFNSLVLNPGSATVAATVPNTSTFGLTIGTITRNTGGTDRKSVV